MAGGPFFQTMIWSGTSVQGPVRRPSTERVIGACGGVPGPHLCPIDHPALQRVAHKCRPGSVPGSLFAAKRCLRTAPIAFQQALAGRRRAISVVDVLPVTTERPRCSCDAGTSDVPDGMSRPVSPGIALRLPKPTDSKSKKGDRHGVLWHRPASERN